MVTLVQLVAAVPGALMPHNDQARRAVELGGVHISELKDPTPFLDGGELLLTTGIPLTGSGTEIRRYVERLRARAVGALAVGVGPHLDAVPGALTSACADTGMPLLVVPPEGRFAHITRAYWDLVSASGRASLVARLGTQTALVREAGKPDGIAGVVSLVAQAVGGWAAYLPLHGGTPVIWPESMAGVIPGLQTEAQRFAERGDIGAATFPLHGHDVVAHPVGSGSQVRGAFAVAAGRRPSNADKQLILTATAVLALRERGASDPAALNRAVGEAVLNLLLSGEVTAAQALTETTGAPPLPSMMQVLAYRSPDAGSTPGGHDAMLVELVSRGLITAGAAERSRPARATTVGGIGVLLLSGPQSADDPPETARATRRAGLTGALSEVVRARELVDAAAAAVRRAREVPDGEIAPAQIAGSGTSGELAAERLAAYTRAPLVETTRSFLRHRGSWEAAARELGVHRNTIRNRMRIVQEELGIDLDDPDLSAELWIALRTRAPQRRTVGP